MLRILFALLFVSLPALADDDWVCREMASKREDRAILTCGIGQAATEADAREEAMKHAKAEFTEICESSADCRGYETVLVPLRNQCQPAAKGGFECWRAIRFEILDEKIQKIAREAPPGDPRAPASAESPSETVVTVHIIDQTKEKHFMLGAKFGAAGATFEGTPAKGFLAIPILMEWKWGRAGLRLGLEFDSAGSDNSAGSPSMSGWQGLTALPLYLIDDERHALIVYPQLRLSVQTYSSPGGSLLSDQSFWQRGWGGGVEYRLSIGPVVRLVVGSDFIRYGDDDTVTGRWSVGGSAGVLFLL